jgi:hypothetical protein
MERPAAIQVGDVIKDKGDVVTLEDTGTLYDARNLMIRHSISRLSFSGTTNMLLELLPKKTSCVFFTKARTADA